jgi:protein-S-isoprenylcysteine O-methyltransferase Ste14
MRSYIRYIGNLVGIIGVGGLAGWLALWLRSLDPRLGLELPVWTLVPGVLVLIAGVALALASTLLLLSAGLGSSRGKDFIWTTKFVAVGPFRHVRNPMSLGAVMYLVGLGLILQSGSVLTFAALLFVICNLFVIFIEEPGLEQRFGQSYLEYKCQVHRWLPKWRPLGNQPLKQSVQPTGATPSITGDVEAPEGRPAAELRR